MSEVGVEPTSPCGCQLLKLMRIANFATPTQAALSNEKGRINSIDFCDFHQDYPLNQIYKSDRANNLLCKLF